MTEKQIARERRNSEIQLFYKCLPDRLQNVRYVAEVFTDDKGKKVSKSTVANAVRVKK